VIDRVLELRDERVELIDNGADRLGLAEIAAGALEQRHRVIAPDLSSVK
jgi:hypothetical protein